MALGRWHPSWGERPDKERDRERTVRRLAAAAPRLIPFAAHRYLVALPGADDVPVIAVHGADAAVIAPDLRSGLLRELGLADPAGTRSAPAEGGAADADAGSPGHDTGGGNRSPAIPFWSDVVGGIPWQPFDRSGQT